MKQSKYNFFYQTNNEFIVYNSFSNALAVLSEQEYLELQNLHNTGILGLQLSEIEKLKKGNFIIEDDIDELFFIRERLYRARYSTETLGLTIAPTLECNFNCDYCYEHGCSKSYNMPIDVQEQLIKLVENSKNTIRHLAITWYGGEPLLAINIIKSLTERFLDICYRFDIEYSAAIITNGYLLNEEIVNQLVDYKVSFCQVTIDGTREQHNIRRKHKSGIDTYDVIVNNVKRASEKIRVSVRVNTDKNNKDACSYVKDMLNSDNFDSIIVYSAPIRDSNGCYSTSECFTGPEFLQYEMNQLIKCNSLNELKKKYPRIQGNVCCADTINSYVICPNGDIFKCWSDIGREEYRVGNIKSGEKNPLNEIKYFGFDPMYDKKCRNCKFLPVCMGGCPREVINDNDNCLFTEALFEEYIRFITAKIRNEKS